MDKSCHSSGDSTTTNSSSSTSNINDNTDQYLRHLNKISHKISKPTRRPTPDHHHHHQNIHAPPLPPPPPEPPQNQPPVYNIKKSDFRDVVQKLTGSPAHDRFSTPPPIQPPKPPSSRLQRIRPPPLAQLSNRPPPLLNSAAPPQPLPSARQVAPLSPLPPFPAVHAAAESPISAYMRYFQSTVDADLKRFSGLSPRWSNLGQPHPPPNHQPPLPPAAPPFPSPTSGPMTQSPLLFPTSPLPFGCLPSPRSSYPLLSPSLLFSPSATGQLGFQPFPVSPRFAVPSPRWKDL
ncbi:VQ motif-containing protein [Actinidia chinensis var. chinensis]|uniref:VQ motif-containing protein n=1 Tax=Actinidia chinensis var. chinensis TaxID=1590841 RepID=A0A2R6RNM6_ACTCC|nr:VQ motif-containing protein [Actinidia chinensis var. chinensis]